MKSSRALQQAALGGSITWFRQGSLRWPLKVLLSLVLLGLILRSSDPRQFWGTLRGLDVKLFVIALALFLPSQLFAAYRWGYVLGHLQRPLPFRLLVRHSLLGQLSALVLPGQVSGDVVRTFAAAQGQEGKVRFALSVVIEKVALLVAMAAVALLGLVGTGPVSELSAVYWLALGVLLLALLSFIILCQYRPRHIPTTAIRLIECLPFGRRLVPLAEELASLPRFSPGSTFAILALALALQLAHATGSYLFAQSMHISIRPIDWMSINALVALVQILPLTVGGLGVREGALAGLLALYGVPVAQSTAYSLAGFVTGAMQLYAGWLLVESISGSSRWRERFASARQHAGVGAFLVLVLLLGGLNLKSAPPLWWDEGWNLTVIRNWVELGLYGRLLAGQPASPEMTTGFPAIAPIALSFKLFGAGIAQGRIVAVLFMAGAIACLYHLSLRLYSRRIAVATLAVLMLMSGNPDIHPLLIGRQVLGEPAMLFYLLGGYLALLLALRGRSWMIVVAVACWGLALATKLQALPFWALSLALPLAAAAIQRRWRLAAALLISLLGSYAAAKLLGAAWHWLLRDHMVAGTPVSGLVAVTAVVTSPTIRVTAVLLACLFGLPTFFGLAYAARRFVGQRGLASTDVERDAIRLALLTLAGGWLAWYVALSAAWLRYLFPAVFAGSMFTAALLHTLTGGFNLKTTLQRAASDLARLRMSWQGVGAMLAILLVVTAFTATLVTLHWAYFVNTDQSVVKTAEYLNTETEPDALIETYNTELFFLLDRDYHYPPDQIHVELQRRNLEGPRVVIPYDPLASDPDYLVVGRANYTWNLYEPVLATGAFRLKHVEGQYDIYERVR